MSVAYLGWAACALVLGCAERPEFCLTAAVALIWTLLAPLYGAADRMRAAMLAGCSATPFLGVSAAADVFAGASLLEVLGVALVGLGWSLAVACAAATARANGRYPRFLQLWTAVALLLPLLALALGLAGEAGRGWSSLTAASAPAWLVWRCSLELQLASLESITSAALATLAVAASAAVAANWRAPRRGDARAS